MSAEVGMLLTCECCGASEFLRLKNGCTAQANDGERPTRDKYEDSGIRWSRWPGVGVLCNKCWEGMDEIEAEAKRKRDAFMAKMRRA